jgi:hypothetical protein
MRDDRDAMAQMLWEREQTALRNLTEITEMVAAVIDGRSNRFGAADVALIEDEPGTIGVALEDGRTFFVTVELI